MMKNILFSAALLIPSISVVAMQAIDDQDLGSVTGQEGVNLKIALTANIDNIYFQTDDNRANFANIAIDTDTGLNGLDPASNRPFEIKIDAVNSGFRKGLVLAISEVNSLDFTIQDLSVSHYDSLNDVVSQEAVFGSLGIQKIDFHGGSAEVYMIGRGGVGAQGTEMGMSLPDGTTLDFTINDFEDASGNSVTDSADAVAGSELRATIEINDFSMSSTMDVIQLGKDKDGVDQGTGLLVLYNGLEGAFDVRKFTAGNGVREGSFGRIQIDGLQMKRGYLIVDALGN